MSGGGGLVLNKRARKGGGSGGSSGDGREVCCCGANEAAADAGGQGHVEWNAVVGGVKRVHNDERLGSFALISSGACAPPPSGRFALSAPPASRNSPSVESIPVSSPRNMCCLLLWSFVVNQSLPGQSAAYPSRSKRLLLFVPQTHCCNDKEMHTQARHQAI